MEERVVDGLEWGEVFVLSHAFPRAGNLPGLHMPWLEVSGRCVSVGWMDGHRSPRNNCVKQVSQSSI